MPRVLATLSVEGHLLSVEATDGHVARSMETEATDDARTGVGFSTAKTAAACTCLLSRYPCVADCVCCAASCRHSSASDRSCSASAPGSAAESVSGHSFLIALFASSSRTRVVVSVDGTPHEPLLFLAASAGTIGCLPRLVLVPQPMMLLPTRAVRTFAKRAGGLRRNLPFRSSCSSTGTFRRREARQSQQAAQVYELRGMLFVVLSLVKATVHRLPNHANFRVSAYNEHAFTRECMGVPVGRRKD